MKIWSQVIADARGSCGGVIADRGTSGTIFRSRKPAADRRTQGQLRIRGFYAMLEAIWTGLQMTERDKWREAWQTSHFKPSGITISAGRAFQEPRELFKSVNLRLCANGFPHVRTPPTQLTIPARPTQVYAVTQNVIEITVDSPQDWQLAEARFILKMTRPVSCGRGYKPANMRTIAAIEVTDDPEQWSPLSVPMPNAPIRQAGSHVWLESYVLLIDGSCSTPQLSGPHVVQALP
jgi:hypothetical protein